jgi:hypothetical protein
MAQNVVVRKGIYFGKMSDVDGKKTAVKAAVIV